jgi:HEAT repeat
VQNLSDKDDLVRSAAAEGLGRLKNPMDQAMLMQMFNAEHGMNPRLSSAFALVSLGELKTDRYGPLQYLLNTTNQRTWRAVASAFLIELAREQAVRQAIYSMLGMATKDEKIQLSIVLSRSGGTDSIPSLEALSRDPDPDVAAEGIRSLRTLRTRLP